VSVFEAKNLPLGRDANIGGGLNDSCDIPDHKQIASWVIFFKPTRKNEQIYNKTVNASQGRGKAYKNVPRKTKAATKLELAIKASN